jgi:hypothetical protein
MTIMGRYSAFSNILGLPVDDQDEPRNYSVISGLINRDVRHIFRALRSPDRHSLKAVLNGSTGVNVTEPAC